MDSDDQSDLSPENQMKIFLRKNFISKTYLKKQIHHFRKTSKSTTPFYLIIKNYNTMSKPGVTKENNEQKPSETIFAKMAKGEIKPKTVYEDDECLVFKDMSPQAPTHLLIISKTVEIGKVHEAKSSDAKALGHLLYVAGVVAKKLDIDQSGYRLVINQGIDACQSVNYLHIHLFAGKKMKWPPL